MIVTLLNMSDGVRHAVSSDRRRRSGGPTHTLSLLSSRLYLSHHLYEEKVSAWYAFTFVYRKKGLRHKMAAASLIKCYSQSLQLLQVLEGSSLDGADFILH